MEPKRSGFMSSQIMTPAEARRDTKNLFHEMSVFTLQNITDLTEQDGSVNSKVQGLCECGYKRSDPIRAGNKLTSCIATFYGVHHTKEFIFESRKEMSQVISYISNRKSERHV
jgi:hypothetical protein